MLQGNDDKDRTNSQGAGLFRVPSFCLLKNDDAAIVWLVRTLNQSHKKKKKKNQMMVLQYKGWQ